MNKPTLTNFTEAAQVFFYSAWAMLYYAFRWQSLNHYVHVLWFVGWGALYHYTQADLHMFIGLGPALAYSLAWMFGLGNYFEKKFK